MTQERLPPNDLDAENSVLGSILIDQDAMTQVADVLKAEHFYKRANSVIFEAMMTLYEERTPTDIVMVSETLARNGELETVGGRSYLSSLSNQTPTAVHAAQYAAIVRRKASLRSLIGAAGQIAAIAYEDGPDADEAMDRAQSTLFAVATGTSRSKFKPVKALLHEAYDKLDYLHQHKGQVTGIPSGIRDLDVITQGFQPSDLIILAARPSVGKTSFALNITEHAGTREGKRVGLFSLEMSEEQLIMRLLSSVSGVDSQRMRSGFLEDEDFMRMGPAMNDLSKADIYIDDTPSLTINELRTKARRLQIENGVDLIVVDYLQLMHAPGAGGKENNRVQEVSAISRGLKAIARELDVPVLALSQLSRQTEGRESGEPRLSDLRESGAIEQDADIVMFLWKPKPEPGEYHDDLDGDWVNLKVAKHRNGPIGDVDLFFRKNQTRFYPLEERLR